MPPSSSSSFTPDDPAGNITEIEDQAYATVFWDNMVVEPRQLFEYDALYRLVSASGRETAEGGNGWSGADPDFATGFPVTDQTLRRYVETYEYDAAGNFLTFQHAAAQPASGWTQHYEPAADSNRLLATWRGSDRTSTEMPFTYDRHGNIRRTTRADLPGAVRWDPRDMIREAALGGGAPGYQYDSGKQRTRKRIAFADGKRLLGTDSLSTASSVIDASKVPRSWKTSSCITCSTTTSGCCTSRTCARPLALMRTGRRIAPIRSLRYQDGNHLGSVHLELDGTAEIIGYEEFHPYGSSAYRASASGIEAASRRYRYAGMERDEELGLNYHHARYLAPWLGRWMSCDPAGFISGVNLFVYADGTRFRSRTQRDCFPLRNLTPPGGPG